MKKEDSNWDQEIESRLRENFVVDLKKPEIDQFERAVIIRKVLDEKKWSIREMAKQWGFSKSTLEDWLLFNKLTQEEYEKLLKKGMTHTEIYRSLREQRTKTKTSMKIVKIDFEIKKMLKVFEKATDSADYTDKTTELVAELKTVLKTYEAMIKNDKNV